MRRIPDALRVDALGHGWSTALTLSREMAYGRYALLGLNLTFSESFEV